MEKIAIDRALGKGWVATEARLTSMMSSIAVVSIVRDKTTVDTRIDLGKRIFLDSVPESLPKRAAELVAGALGPAVREAQLQAMGVR